MLSVPQADIKPSALLIGGDELMAGHSKWKNIQKTKGAQDAKRGKIFTKIAREITVAVKEGGGGDPANNSRLAAAITKAKAANMPNDNIKRTIDKALGSGDSSNYETIIYEGYGPCGVAVIVETMTDNRNRTASEMRHYFDKYGGNMGTSGCVAWSFDRKGVIIIDNEDQSIDEDQVMMDALEAGAADIENAGGAYEIYTDTDEFQKVVDAMEKQGYNFLSAQIEMVPQNYIKLTSEDDIKNMQKMLDMFEDNDDVQNIWHNWEEE
jgi:YebC/PmpR family DNA-binding regulatory protein